ncbi:NADP-dependent glyceraldehyde-3-phosphate dehydrogenase [Leptospira idonii]|uniref:NADP-dependent glyceraldehyde-3-phosphate dehydrogenase n=1 Tax=Leptospira idonii TaxID=1193500 RepID=A0A4R9M658_9LEPT|nr:NADP-dependent glyceraldehyde-3-phosphate dehydrogenase [Leptospira idonii]TGN20669.1 NADP-dependent glyceraldehyde-3-phosphate dehydrogenase [Leptospira idonii]
MSFSFPKLESIPEKFRILPIHQKRFLLDGELKVWEGKMEKVLSPIHLEENGKLTQVLLGSYPSFDERQAMAALESCLNAYRQGSGDWPQSTTEQRIGAIERFTELMMGKKEEIIKLLMWEIGKTHADSIKEFERTVEYIRDTIDALREMEAASSQFVYEKGIVAQIKRAPYGVVLCMGPFNYPLNETFCTLIPALAMGNTVLFKPAKFGVLLLEPLLECFQQAFPKGVINTLYGDGATVVSPIMESGKIDVFAFIGSSTTANLISKKHPKLNRLRSVLGLNAKNPAILLEDCDIDASIKEIVSGSLSYNGQRCTALKIIFVPESKAEEFTSKYLKVLSEWKSGMPWEKDVLLTPLPEEGKTKWLSELLQDATDKGAKIINANGGEVTESFMSPAVLFPVSKDSRIYKEEQFGPIVPIVPYKSIEETLDYVRISDMGQQASLFGKDPVILGKLVDLLVNQVARVNLNAQCQRGPDRFPFTGRKDSADGTLSVTDALRVFSIRSLVAAKEEEGSKEILRSILKTKSSRFLNTDSLP